MFDIYMKEREQTFVFITPDELKNMNGKCIYCGSQLIDVTSCDDEEKWFKCFGDKDCQCGVRYSVYIKETPLATPKGFQRK